MTEENIKICTYQIAEIGEFNLVDKVEVDLGMKHNYRNDYRRGNLREI